MKIQEGFSLFLLETPNGRRYWRYASDDGDTSRSYDLQHTLENSDLASEYSSLKDVGEVWVEAKNKVGKICEDCNTSIVEHADNSLLCGCSCLDFNSGQDNFPAGW